MKNHMSDFNLEKIELKFKEISDDLLKIVNDINDNEIPTRESLINLLYLEEMKNYDIFYGNLINKETIGLNQKIQEVEKSRNEIIKILLEDLKQNPEEKGSLLKKIFDSIHEISDPDKKVLLKSLENSSIEEIIKAVDNIMTAFCSETD